MPFKTKLYNKNSCELSTGNSEYYKYLPLFTYSVIDYHCLSKTVCRINFAYLFRFIVIGTI